MPRLIRGVQYLLLASGHAHHGISRGLQATACGPQADLVGGSYLVAGKEAVRMSLDEALGIWAEAAQDLSSAGLALAASNYYNCADLANQVAEKSLQAVYVLNHDARATYDHDLRALGTLVSAPSELLETLDTLTPYHPANYLTDDLPAELADDAVGPDKAQELLDNA